MILARDLYLRSVEADPKYAPAWACLGRTHRFLGKYGVEDQATNLARAEEAFRKAFALNPELALAHNFYTALQTDLGRSLDAMERLLKRAHTHHNDLESAGRARSSLPLLRPAGSFRRRSQSGDEARSADSYQCRLHVPASR